MIWRLLVAGKSDPSYNMAVDEAIMLGIRDGTSEPTVRFYDWDPPTVSCGYNQSFAQEVDFELIAKEGFGFVRRPTGGRVVLHNNEITYSVIAPITGRFSGGLTASYSEISKALATGLQLMGIDVEFEKGNLNSSAQRESYNPCFSSSSRYELVVDKKKIVGSAQVRKDGILLQHGSILLHHDQRKVASIIHGLTEAKRKKLAEFLSKKTVAINQLLQVPIEYEQAVKLLRKGFEKAWSEDRFYSDDNLQHTENKRVKYLIETKYLTDDWNMRK